MHVVIDKSYLQGASVDTIQRLCGEHKVLFIETLLYELLTTETNQVRTAGRLCELWNGHSRVTAAQRQVLRSSSGRSLGGKVLERLGILPRFQSRWDDEGNWRW
jgi:hypothetical protein